MPGPKLSPTERERVLSEVARFEDEGCNHFEIASRVGVDRSMVGKYLKILRKRYAESSLERHEHSLKKKLRQFGRLMSEAWAFWEKSKSEGGEPRYLEIVRQCLADESKVLGLNETHISVDVTQRVEWDSFLAPMSNVIDQTYIERICSQVPDSDSSNGQHNGELNGKHD